jgi:hypothetical protein
MMSAYRLSLLGANSKVIAVQQFRADNDREALTITRESVKGYAGLSSLELWRGTKRVDGKLARRLLRRIVRASKPDPAQTTLRLSLDLVPAPLWGQNLRSPNVLGNKRWRRLRQGLLEVHGSACAICGSEEQPHAHEVWRYDETKRRGKATLLRIEIICWMCHYVHHFGLATRLVDEDRLTKRDIANLRRHFARVNKCKVRDFDLHLIAAMDQFEQRSEKRWTVDYGPYADLAREAVAKRVSMRAKMAARAGAC